MTPEEFLKILLDVPEPKPIFYRLYHDNHGRPLVYSMEDLPGDYVEIDQDTYVKANYRVKVVDGRIKELPPVAWVSKLVPNGRGTCCHPEDVSIVVPVDLPNIKWSLNTHEDD